MSITIDEIDASTVDAIFGYTAYGHAGRVARMIPCSAKITVSRYQPSAIDQRRATQTNDKSPEGRCVPYELVPS
jgi:hypothetical protein